MAEQISAYNLPTFLLSPPFWIPDNNNLADVVIQFIDRKDNRKQIFRNENVEDFILNAFISILLEMCSFDCQESFS